MKKIKKLLCFIFAIIFIISTAFALPVAAADTDIELRVTTPTAIGGDTVEVELYVDKNPGLAIMTFTIFFDTDVLTFTEMRKGPHFKSYELADNSKKGYLSFINWDNTYATNVYHEGLLMTLVFKVREDAETKTYPITIKNFYPDTYGTNLKNCFVNQDGTVLNPIVTNGGVTVGKSCKNGWHTYGEWQTVQEATCNEKGSKKKVCNYCPHAVFETIPKQPHDYETFRRVDVLPTQDVIGVLSYHCKNCDEVKDKAYLKLADWKKGGLPTTVGATVSDSDWKKVLEKISAKEEDVTSNPTNKDNGTSAQNPSDKSPENTPPEASENTEETNSGNSSNISSNASEIFQSAEKSRSEKKLSEFLNLFFGNGVEDGLVQKVIAEVKTSLENLPWIKPVQILLVILLLF